VVPEQESAELYDRWTVPSPGKPLFEAALANFTPRSPAEVNTANKTRGPLLLTAAGNDHTVPAAITTSTRKLYHKSPAITDFIEFPDRGHSLTIDHGWREIAQIGDGVLGRLKGLCLAYSEGVAHERITVNPNRISGLPCIRDTRVTVSAVLGQLAAGSSIEEILVDYPYLEPDDILAALEFAAAAVQERELPLALPA
jgi:uncharacterized protein (DUF433 family)